MMVLTKQQQDYKNCNKQVFDRMKTMADQITAITANNQRQSSNFQNRSSTYRTLVCFHCAKNGHRFEACQVGSDQDKARIRELIKEKKFDFQKLNERAERNKSNYNKNSLNLSAPQSPCQ